MTQESNTSLIDNVRIAVEAIRCAMKRYDDAGWENDRSPMDFIDKIAFLVKNLRPGWLREQAEILSSINYGRYVFSQVFPRYDNPEDFSSTEFEIKLDEHPVQVMGWAEQKQLVEEGARMNLNRDWIDVGFELESRDRGIDLEWHFFENPQSRGDKEITSP